MVEGKNVTGFTNSEEEAVGLTWERTAKRITRPLKVEELCKAFVLHRESKGNR
jgi:hypothetical protein